MNSEGPDASSDSEYDFGHFDALDSDVSSQAEVVQDSVDPFTAAQRAQAEDDSVSSEDEVDDKFAFTQRLLTNAKTLRQLSQQTASVELEFDQNDRGSPSPRKTKLDSSPSLPSRSQDSSFAPSQQYVAPSRELFSTVRLLDDEVPVPGRHMQFAAGTLKQLRYPQFHAVLGMTRRYQIDAFGPAVCLKTLWSGQDIRSSPVFQIVSFKDSKAVLQDRHESPCRILAQFEHAIDLNSYVEIQVLDCIFDHAATLSHPHRERSSGIVPAQEQHADRFDVLKAMSTRAPEVPEHGPPNTMATPHSVPSSASVLIILKSRIMTQALRAELQAASNRKDEAVRHFNSDMPHSTAETNYSEGAEIDIDDFPIELQD